MSATDTSDLSRSDLESLVSEDERREMTQRRWPFFLIGVFSIFAGATAIAMPLVATLSATLLLGAILLASGLVSIFSAFWEKFTQRIIIELIVGILSVLGGAALFLAPYAGALSITILLASFFAASGMMRLIWAARHRQDTGMGWLALGGLLALVLAALLLLELPFNAFWVPGLLLGIDLIVNGTTMLIFWAQMRRDSAAS